MVGHIYNIQIIFNGSKYYKSLYVREGINVYDFVLDCNFITNNARTITFLLTDLNYENLIIERGNLILWQQ